MVEYKVNQTAPTVYLDNRGIATKGYIVYVYLVDFDETHSINVPTLDPKLVALEVKKLLDNRKALDKLGQS